MVANLYYQNYSIIRIVLFQNIWMNQVSPNNTVNKKDSSESLATRGNSIIYTLSFFNRDRVWGINDAQFDACIIYNFLKYKIRINFPWLFEIKDKKNGNVTFILKRRICIFMLVAGGRRYILLFANMTLSINKYVYFYCTATIRIELVSLVGYTCLQFCKTIRTILLQHDSFVSCCMLSKVWNQRRQKSKNAKMGNIRAYYMHDHILSK